MSVNQIQFQTYLRLLESSGIHATVVPLKPGTKIPAVRWAARNAEFPDGTMVADRPDTQARAVLTGDRSGGLVVIDLDNKPGADGLRACEVLEARLGPLPATLTVRSPTGGLHLYFKHPAAFRSDANVLAPGVDIRGQGGIVVTAGSAHKSVPGTYEVEEAVTVANLPARWADMLPRARTPLEIGPVTYVPAEASELRQRLKDTAHGRHGDGWKALRKAVGGERMFRIEGGPGVDSDPLVHGVDEFLSKAVIWPLAHSDGWETVSPADFATLMEPSMSLLRQDAQAIGQVSKFTLDYVAAKWEAAVQKAAAEKAAADTWVRNLEAAIAENRAKDLPALLQFDRRYMILDDRDEGSPTYVGPLSAEGVPLMARTLWGDKRPIETVTEKGTRDMTAGELCSSYGRPIDRLVVDYSATEPRIEDLTAVVSPERDRLPIPTEDVEVAAWLSLLDPTGALATWIAWASPERAQVTVPALCMVGGAHVGKSLLADSIARAAGLRKAAPLGRALGRFNSVLSQSPILFSDEGIPRGANGQPLTEEFRGLVTAVDHWTELKGSDKKLLIRGGVRVILAANRVDRLFQNKGHLSADDVEAITRRLFVVEITGERIPAAKAAAAALGKTEGDPARLARVAGHLRWIQTNARDLVEVKPTAALVQRELRLGGDLARAAISLLEDRLGEAPFLIRDDARNLIWVRPDAMATAMGQSNAGPMLRVLASYLTIPSTKYRKHPITQEPLEKRERWAALDLAKLVLDGVDFS